VESEEGRNAGGGAGGVCGDKQNDRRISGWGDVVCGVEEGIGTHIDSPAAFSYNDKKRGALLQTVLLALTHKHSYG